MTTHELQPTEYLYRGHYIARHTCAPSGRVEWRVTDMRHGEPMFVGQIDDCTEAIDEVMADIEAA